MTEIVQFTKAVGALVIGILAIGALALVVAFTIANPWIIIVALVGTGIIMVMGFVLVVHIIHNQIDKHRHLVRMRELEHQDRADQIAGRQADRVRLQNVEAEQFRLQWQAQDLLKLRPGETLVARRGDSYEPVYVPPLALPPGRYVSADLAEDDDDDEMPALSELRRPVPDALAVIMSGQLPTGDDVLLGFDVQSNAVVRAWKMVKAVLILGLQGGGKTTTALWLILQMIVKGARLGVIDKHAHSKDDSLWNRIKPLKWAFEAPLGDTPQAALRVIAYADKLLKARLATQLPCSYPFLLVIDEFTRIMSDLEHKGEWAAVATALLPVLEAYNSEGRGHRCFAICIGQAANASRSGGTEVRDLFNTRLVHRMRAKQAQMLSLTEHQNEIARLQMGAIFVDMETDDPFQLFIPNVTVEAMEAVSARLQRGRDPETPRKLVQPEPFTSRSLAVQTHPLNGQTNAPERAVNASSRTERLRERAEKVLELRRLNPPLGKQAIVQEVWHCTKGGSAAYKQGCEEYDRIVRYWEAQGELQA